MTPRAAFVLFLATVTILCQAAPLQQDRVGKNFSSSLSSTGAPLRRSAPPQSATPSQDAATTSSSTILPSTSPPLGSATQNATSAPTPTSMASPMPSYTLGTRGNALQHLVPGLLPRWVIANGIGSTQIGQSDPAGSNKDLNAAVNVVFAESNHQTWVDTYIDFLLEAGDAANTTLNGETFNDTEYTNVRNAWEAEQVKLVRAYEAAHQGNFTYVGIDIANVSKVDPLDMTTMEFWAYSGGDVECTSMIGRLPSGNFTSNSLNGTGGSSSNHTSGGGNNCTFGDGLYTGEDYKKLQALTSQVERLEAEQKNLSTIQQMLSQGYMLKHTFPELGIFNLSMDIGGEGDNTQYVPAWTATVIAYSAISANGTGIAESSVDSHLKDGPTDSTDNSTIGLIERDAGTGQSSSRGFGALQFLAHSINSTAKSHSKSIPPMPAAAAAAAVSAVSAGFSTIDPLNQPMANNQFLLALRVQEGTWANGRNEWIEFAREHTPDVADKYFGPGSSGSGLIGRRWSYLILIVTIDIHTSEMVSAELFGKVYEILPELSS